MRTLLFCFFCCATSVLAQPGFNKYFDFGGISSDAINMLVDQDTIILYGLSLSPPPAYQWGVVFAKLDTLGNVLTSKIAYDTAGGHFGEIKDADIKILQDHSGYILVGTLYSRDAGFLMQFDRLGNLSNYQEYPDAAARAILFRKIIEVEDGFLIFGSKQKLDYYLDAFVLKVDKTGYKIWEKSYETPGFDHNTYCALQINANTFVIGSDLHKIYPEVGSASHIWAIDSTGNVLWQWQADNFTEDGSVVGLQSTSDGGWIYYSGDYTWVPPNWLIKTKIIKRDSNFNLVWQRYVSPIAYPYTNYAIDIKPAGADNYVAVGTWSTAEPGSYVGGSLYKISTNGDSLWSRLDTALFDHHNYPLNEYSGVGVLSSGSVVAFGYAVQDFPGIGGYYAWLVKVNAMGAWIRCCA